MEKSDAIKLAVDLMKPLIEKGQISVTSGIKDGTKNLLDNLEALAQGIMEIEKKP